MFLYRINDVVYFLSDFDRSWSIEQVMNAAAHRLGADIFEGFSHLRNDHCYQVKVDQTKYEGYLVDLMSKNHDIKPSPSIF